MISRTAETWGCPGPVRKHPGSVCCGMFLLGRGEVPTVEESSTSYEESPATSTSLQKLSMFTTGLPSIIFGLSRRIISSHLLERSTGSSTFYRPRWKHICPSSTKYGPRSNHSLSGKRRDNIYPHGPLHVHRCDKCGSAIDPSRGLP